MYLLSQLWLYLLLAALAGIGLGIALWKPCRQRDYETRLAALETQHRDERTRAESLTASLATLETERTAERDALRAEAETQAVRLATLEAEHRACGERAEAQSGRIAELEAALAGARTALASTGQARDEHQAALAALGTRHAALDDEHRTLRETYESRVGLLNAETTRALALSEQLAELQGRHDALDARHAATLAEHAAVAREAYETLQRTQSELQAERQQGADLLARLTELEGRHQSALASHAGSARQAQEALDQAQAERQALADELASERRTAMAAAATAAAAALAAVQQHRGELGEQAARHGEQLAALQARVDELTEELAGERQAAHATASSHQIERNALQVQLDARTAAAEQTEQARAALADELAALQARLVAADEALAGERNAAMAAAAAAAAAALAVAQQHRDELARSQAQADERAQSIAVLTQARDALVGERDDLQARLETLTLRLGDEVEAGRRALAQALGEQREAHAQAWADIEAQLAERDQQLADLQRALAEQAQARQDALAQADAQAAAQSTTLLREQALQQELDAARSALAECQAARETAPAAPLALVEVPAVPPRPPVSAAAQLGAAELERLVVAAGAGRAPVRVEGEAHGASDDLKIIDGIGPVNEAWLHAQGVRYFWQIASWTPDELAWVAQHLPNFGTRVYRENWVAQAARLAAQQTM